jgi:hypothetical protein
MVVTLLYCESLGPRGRKMANSNRTAANRARSSGMGIERMWPPEALILARL